MRFWLFAILVGGMAYGISEGANAHNIPKRGVLPPVTTVQMVTFGTAEAPIGHVEFCQTHQADCTLRGKSSAVATMTDERLKELKAITREINRGVRPMSDLEQYGVIEKWTYPDSGKGDCEDYVLLKQRMLIKAGWPQSALLITVVRDENGEGHAVLTVRTDRGDYILDNKNSEVLYWREPRYHYIKRQSAIDPQRWESVLPAQHGPAVAAAGLQPNK